VLPWLGDGVAAGFDDRSRGAEAFTSVGSKSEEDETVPEVVVETKLLVPRLRHQTVPRLRLEELLRRGADTTLTLLSAPAGFGKTTLLGTWLAHRSGAGSIAWVSLDERDTDPWVFWTHLLHAVDRAVPGSATSALAQLGSNQPQLDEGLSLLVNELSVSAAELSVVLDDYHLAESPAIQPGISFLLEHLPPQAHLVISTRVDPALPLSRMRARGEVVEIRAADLRFTSDEAAFYLNEINALALDATDVEVLESRTEGWAAALQLAALSLQGKEDATEFISGFAGDDRFVVDYFADEVLDRQPPDVRAFLLGTSVLDELTASLCDAVTGRAGSKAMLERLERQNLFLVSLDDRRHKYRYHHLFADVLRARLLEENRDDAARLHRRASDWYHDVGDPEAAVRHAVAAGDLALAADRIERAIPALLRDRREAVLRRWARDLPAGIVRNRPVVAVGFIGGLMSSNDFEGVAPRLEYVEDLLKGPVEDLVVADRSELARLRATVETYRAALCLVRGEPQLTAHHAELALAHAAADDHLSIASASAVVGLASWADGDLAAAHQGYRSVTDHLERAGHITDVLGCSITLADIEITQGRLGEARRTCERALALADGLQMRGVSDMNVGLSRVAWEHGDLVAAAEYLRRADEAGDACGLPQNPYRWRVMMARLRHAEGDMTTAVELLEEADRVYVGDFLPNVQPVAAVRARLLAAAGDIAGARAWARQHGVTAGDELTYLSEYNHLTLARILLAEYAAGANDDALPTATALLAGILTAARRGNRTGTVIEVLTLQALTQRASGDLESAISTLAQAAQLAEPEGFVRVFIDEGAAMRALLEQLDQRHPRSSFIQRLLQQLALRDVGSGGASTGRAGTGGADEPTTRSVGPALDGQTPGATSQTLVEPLSDRESDVLRLLGSDLSGPDIARRLHVSLATVRTHTQHIYSKLGVNNRSAAVRRAHQLDLFPRVVR
jgi:LuxR family maltose regulon positive regulatory protein